jgi:hypothetical protein
MRIYNINLGHQCNSSSDHNTVFVGHPVSDHDVKDRQFGWHHFTAASVAAKRDYLALTLSENLRRLGFSPALTQAVIDGWCTNNKVVVDSSDNYIDHQSQWTLPRAWDGLGVDIEFFNALKVNLLAEGVVILGGNDNGDEGHELLAPPSVMLDWPIPKDTYQSDYLARPDGVYWTIFNRVSGTKIRFSFDREAPEYVKTSAPEHIEVNVTDWCDRGCEFCYRDCTPSGQHANTNAFYAITRAVEDHRIFSVGLGGGETTAHPKFREIVSMLAHTNAVVTFTTATLDWLIAPWAPEVIDKVSQFAYTVRGQKEALDAITLLNSQRVPISKLRFNVPLEVASYYELPSILETGQVHDIPVTLLGFKDIGRGKTYRRDKDTMSQVFKALARAKGENKIGRIGIDTVLADKYMAEINGIIPYYDHFATGTEGKFGCFVDAVSGTIARSSYQMEDSQVIKFDRDFSANLLKVYQTF